MQIVITVEQGKVRLQIDQEQAVEIKQTVEPGKLPEAKIPKIEIEKPSELVPAGADTVDCGYCRKRGEPCVRHGGDDSQNYKGKAKQRQEGRPKSLEPKIEYRSITDHQPIPNTGLKQSDITNSNGAFLDPWNCEKCRNLQSLCSLHEGLTTDGQKPLIYKHNERTANVSSAS